MSNPLSSIPADPKGLAFAITSESVWGTDVMGIVPTLEKLPETTILWDLIQSLKHLLEDYLKH